jgi:hypothetical protein
MDVRVQEDVHQEIHNHNLTRNRCGRGAWHSVPRRRESQITASDNWAGGMLGAKCTIVAIVLKELMGVYQYDKMRRERKRKLAI